MEGIFLVNNKGVKSFQSADYNTYYALAEIIDNSIQAKARNIHIIGAQENVQGKKRITKKLREVVIYDDGSGMPEDIARICLQLGGGNHIGATENLGKFGMGLPQASGSQCNRTEIYTWQKAEEIFHTYLDYDELIEKNPPMLPELTRHSRLPAHLRNLVETAIKIGGHEPFSENKGTIIYWRDCQKLNHKTYPAFYRNFEEFIGRVYRYYLSSGELNISLTGFDKIDQKYQQIQDKKLNHIRVNDPLFLMGGSIIETIDPKYKDVATNDLHGAEIYSIEDGGKKYNVRIKFSVAKNELRENLQKDWGTEPGSTPIGKLYQRNMGISLIRAGRELKIDDFGFLGDRSNPTQRWWGAEVEFQPDLDDLFGVTFDKQEAKSFKYITKEEYQEDLDESEDESLNLMYVISQKLANNISQMRKILTEQTAGKGTNRKNVKTVCEACGVKAVVDNKCSQCGHILRYCSKHTDQKLDPDGNCPVCNIETPVPNTVCTKHNVPLIDGKCELCIKNRTPGQLVPDSDVKKLRMYLEDNFSNYKGNKYLLDQAIKYFQHAGTDHFIVYTSADSNSFITYTNYGQITIIALNKNHPFFEKFMDEIISDEDRSIDELIPIHLLVGALVNAELQDYENKEILEDHRQQFAMNLKKLMKTYSFPD